MFPPGINSVEVRGFPACFPAIKFRVDIQYSWYIYQVKKVNKANLKTKKRKKSIYDQSVLKALRASSTGL